MLSGEGMFDLHSGCTRTQFCKYYFILLQLVKMDYRHFMWTFSVFAVESWLIVHNASEPSPTVKCTQVWITQTTCGYYHVCVCAVCVV